MARPNFFCDIDSLNCLLRMEFEDNYEDLPLTVDLIELPYLFFFSADEKSRTVKAVQRGEMYSHDESMGIERGTITVDKETGEGSIRATQELGENMGAFFHACLNLSKWMQDKQLELLYAKLDPEEAGIRLTVENGALQYKVVSGKERPEMMCSTLFGGTVMMRPYMDDFINRSAREEMSPEDLVAAAEDGDEEAMNDLALLFLNGDENKGVKPDAGKAVEWFRRLAEAGRSDAMFNLGLHYAKGHGVERNFAKAAEWMEKAKAAGDEDAPKLIEEYRKLAEAGAKAEAGDAQAQADLANGLMKLGGSLEQAGTGSDYEQSAYWAGKAADQNNGDGIWVLALAYEHGRGVEENKDKAIELFRRGAELGHAACMQNLACYYARGDYLKKDEKKAFALFEQAAMKGNGLAMRDLGRCYQFGNGCRGNMKKAVEWYEKALKVIDDPELARKVPIYKMMGENDPNWDEDYPGEDETDEEHDDGLPEGVFDAPEIMKKNLAAAGKDASDEALSSLSVEEAYKAFFGDDAEAEEKGPESVTAGRPSEEIGASDFQIENSTLLRYTGTAPSPVIPDGVTKIGSGGVLAFMNTGVRQIAIPEGVREIGSYAFMSCGSLEKIELPDSLKTIGDHAFRQCDHLKNVTIPDGIEHIERETFWGCTGLESVKLPGALKTIGEKAFSGCTSLIWVMIPSGTTAIEDGAFWGDNSLASVMIPAAVNRIGEMAFADCGKLSIFAPKNSYAEQYAAANGIEYQEYNYDAETAGADEGLEAAAEQPPSPAVSESASPDGVVSFDEHLSFLLPEGYSVEKGTDDDGNTYLDFLFTEPEDETPWKVSVKKRKFVDIPAEKANLKGGVPAFVLGKTEEKSVLFFSVKVLLGVAVFSNAGQSWSVQGYRAGREEDIATNADLLAKHMNAVLGGLRLDNMPGNFEKLTGDRLLSTEVVTTESETNSDFSAVTPEKTQHSHLDFLNRTKSTLGILGGLVQVNQTGTEYAFYPVTKLSEGESPLDAVVRREETGDNSFLHAKYAEEMARLFRVNRAAFDHGHDREQEILSGYIRRAYMFDGLRSFAWTLADYCEKQNKAPGQVAFDTLSELAAFVEKRHYLNYLPDSHCPTLCTGDDIHVLYLPDSISQAERTAILASQNKDVDDGQAKTEIRSLEGLREELVWLYPAMETIFDELEAGRDRNEALEGGVADVLYAWCAMTYAAREPIFTEDGPVNNGFMHPEEEAEFEAQMKRMREQHERESRDAWMKENGKYLARNPRITVTGKKFVFSGLEGYDHWPEILDMLLKKGGIHRTAVSGQTDYVVCDPRYAGDSKVRAAREQKLKGKTVQIVLAEDFLKALGFEQKKEKPKKETPKEETTIRPRRDPKDRPMRQSTVSPLEYTQGKSVETEHYTMDVPDGFAILEGEEDRDFIAYREDEKKADFRDSSMVIYAGQLMQQELIKQFGSVEDYVSLMHMQYCSSLSQLRKIFSYNGFMEYRRKELPGGVMISWDDGVLHANATVGMDNHLRMMRIQISNVKKTEISDYETVLRQILDHIHPKNTVKLTPDLNDPDLLSQKLDQEFVRTWDQRIDQRIADLSLARNMHQQGLVAEFQGLNEEGKASEAQFKKDLRGMLQVYSRLYEQEIKTAAEAFSQISREKPDSALLFDLRDSVNKLIKNANQDVTLNGEKIEIISEYVKTAANAFETPEMRAIEQRRHEEKKREEEELERKRREEAERKRKEEEAEAKYCAWEKERKQILSRRESLAQQQIDSRNAKLKAEATQIRQEYDEKYGAIVSKKAEAEKDLAEAKKKRAEVEARPTKGSTIMFAWGIGQALLGMLCIGMESPGIGLVNLIFGVAILGFGVYLKSLSRTSLSKAARAEQAASEALANIPPFPTVEQYAEENKERLNPASLKNGSQITDAQKRDIRSQIDRENPLPIEPPKPASRQRTSYSASVSSSYSASASSSSRALTGQQSKNEIIKKAIELTLESDGPMTVAELLEAVPELDGESAQHASALCRSLRLEGRIESFTDKRKTYFRIPE